MNHHVELTINEDLLKGFCKKNNFVIVTDKMLKENNMYKELVYATNNNFIGKSVYPKSMPLIMNEGVWQKLIDINTELKKSKLCLKIYDAYRPIQIQQIFWDYFYEKYGYNDETLVADPNKYGTHNIKINAVDLTLVKLNGKKVKLPCEFDDFTEASKVNYEGCSKAAKQNRDLLINTAKKHGLTVNNDEWWHFYDNRLNHYGMKYDYSKSSLIPIGADEVFIFKQQ